METPVGELLARHSKVKSKSTLRAVFPGSFDPLTKGHVDIVRRCLRLFDVIIIGVLHNPSKNTLFSVDERLDLIRKEFTDCKSRVVAKSFSGLLVDFCHDVDAVAVVRGLRAISDYDYEAQMALMNKNLADDIETLFLMTSEKHSYISSSLVRQIAQFGGDVSLLVTSRVAKALHMKFSKENSSKRRK